MSHILIMLGGKVINRRQLNKETITIGRAPDNDLVLDNLAISNYHAKIQTVNSQSILIDLGSSNGVMANGALANNHVMQESDLIEIGKSRVAYSASDDAAFSEKAREAQQAAESQAEISGSKGGTAANANSGGKRPSNGTRNYNFHERDLYLGAIREKSNYPAFRFITLLGKFIFYLCAAVVLIIALVGLYQGASTVWVLSGFMLAMLLTIIGKAQAEAALIFADMADALVDMSSRSSSES